MPAVTGAFLACRADLFWRTGGFDEARLSVTFNDVDWCLRLRRLEPRRCIVCAPLLSLIHLESKSRGFDFQDPAKQARAEYERTAFESMAGPDYAAQDTQHPILSRWVRPGSALR
jgi:GT2 family glycosyltransferase